MPAAAVVSSQAPSAFGAPGYAVPLHMAMSNRPPIYVADPPVFYGDSGMPVPQRHVPMGEVVRGVMAHTYQQYDPIVNYANDSYDYADSTPHLNMDNNLAGLGIVRTIRPAYKPQVIKQPLPAPVKSSTIFGVVAGSALLVGASIAIFAYFRSKK